MTRYIAERFRDPKIFRDNVETFAIYDTHGMGRGQYPGTNAVAFVDASYVDQFIQALNAVPAAAENWKKRPPRRLWRQVRAS